MDLSKRFGAVLTFVFLEVLLQFCLLLRLLLLRHRLLHTISHLLSPLPLASNQCLCQVLLPPLLTLLRRLRPRGIYLFLIHALFSHCTSRRHVREAPRPACGERGRDGVLRHHRHPPLTFRVLRNWTLLHRRSELRNVLQRLFCWLALLLLRQSRPNFFIVLLFDLYWNALSDELLDSYASPASPRSTVGNGRTHHHGRWWTLWAHCNIFFLLIHLIQVQSILISHILLRRS